MEDQNRQQNVVVCSLYSLLETAKLSDYYERFLQQGGDDIDQLCEATENEFKEITKLVGMHTKPLHIRRLQKALVEFWTEKNKTSWKTRSNSLGLSWMETWNTGQSSQSTKSNISLTKPTTTTITITTPNSVNEQQSVKSKRGRPSKNEKRVKTGVFELKLPAMEAIIDWENLDEERKQLIREHSRIYGRDTKKRKCVDLNGHEQMINEAAAQLCLRDPTLLVRRDELFTQARRIVRDSGFSFVHGHSRSKFASGDAIPETMVGIGMVISDHWSAWWLVITDQHGDYVMTCLHGTGVYITICNTIRILVYENKYNTCGISRLYFSFTRMAIIFDSLPYLRLQNKYFNSDIEPDQNPDLTRPKFPLTIFVL